MPPIMRKTVIALAVIAAGLAAAATAAVILIPVNPPLISILGRWSAQAAEENEELLRLPAGFKANLYAADLPAPRIMVATSSGDLIVSMRGNNSVMRILPDRDGDGRSDGTVPLLQGLAKPHGLALDEDWLYVAEEARVFRIRYDAASGKVSGPPETVLARLPASGGHWTRTLKRGPDGFFYLTAGSNCNACIEEHPWRAAMVRFRPGEEAELFASGLRNTVGFDWRPQTNELFGVDNGRDYLGEDLPPEELNLIEKGGFYGWPFFYGNNVPDPDYGKYEVPAAVKPRGPVHEFQAHTAPLSIRFLRQLKAPGYEAAALVGLHGSWNRSERVGYEVVSLHWDQVGRISQKPFLTGFLLPDGAVWGRPVDVIDVDGTTLYVSDDAGGAIWRITWRGDG